MNKNPQHFRYEQNKSPLSIRHYVTHSSSKKWLIWTLASLFYFYEVLLRISPTVMVGELMNSFQVNAATIGVISACFFYAYAPMQLPVGILMDRYGARVLLTLAATLSAIGALAFGLTTDVWLLQVARFTIGIGASFGFVGMVFICFHLFSGKQAALMVGLANSIGMLGAVFGAGPLSILVSLFGWRSSILLLGGIGLILAFALFFMLKDRSLENRKEDKESFSTFFDRLKQVLKNPSIWLNSSIALLFYSITTAFADLWGVPFLQEVGGYTKYEAGFGISMIFIGWMVGGPLIGHLSDKRGHRKPFILAGISLTALTLCTVLFYPSLSLPLLYLLLFLIGLFSAAELLNFSLSVEMNPPQAKGSAIAFTNCIVSFGGSLIQPFIGYLLDYHWEGELLPDGVRNYSPYDYQTALSILPVILVVAFLLTLFLREKKNKNR